MLAKLLEDIPCYRRVCPGSVYVQWRLGPDIPTHIRIREVVVMYTFNGLPFEFIRFYHGAEEIFTPQEEMKGAYEIIPDRKHY